MNDGTTTSRARRACEFGWGSRGATAMVLVRDRRPGAVSQQNVLVLGLTNPSGTSVRVLTEARESGSEAVLVFGLSWSPDGAALLRALGLGS